MVQLDSGSGGNTDDDREERRQDDGSADDTTARPGSGAGGTGAASGPSAGGGTGQQTAPGPQDGPQVSSGAAPADAPTAGADDTRELGPGPDGDGGPRTSSGDRMSPVLRSGDDIPPWRRPDTVEDTGGPAPAPGTGLGAGELDTSTIRSVERELERQVGRDLEFGQDFIIERSGSGFTGRPTESLLRELAGEQLEQQIEEATGRDVTPGDEFEVVRTDSGFEAVLSGAFAGMLSREAAREAGVDLGTWGEQVSSMEGPALESGGLEIGVDQFDASGRQGPQALDVEAIEQRGEAIQDVEQQLERQVGQARAAALGITSAGATQQLIESTDLRRGEDYVLTAEQTPGGMALTAELTESYRRDLASDAIEAQLEQQYGMDLTPGQDFRVVEGEDGFAAELTQTGQDAIATREFTSAVARFEEAFGLDVPGEGPVVAGVGEERDLGRFGGEHGQQAEEGGRQLLEPFTTVDARGAVEDTPLDIQFGAVTEEGEVLPVSRGDVGTGGVHLADPIDYGAPVLAEFAGKAPAAVKDLFDVSERFYEQAATGDFEGAVETGTGAGQAVTNQLVLTGEAALRDPKEFAKSAAVSLPLSVAVFGAASRVGPRTSQATRLAIQPGEEALGYGGYGLTRRVAGEARAQQLFPNQEPLFFSEEAAIRAARGAGARASAGARRVADPFEDVLGRARVAGAGATEAVRRAPSFRFETDPEAGLIEIDPAVRAQARRAAARQGERIRASAATVRDVPGRVATGAVETGRRARETGVSAVETGRQQLTLAELRAEDLGFRLGQRTAAGVERAEQLPAQFRQLPGRGVGAAADVTQAARRAGIDVIETGRMRWELAGLRAEDLGFRAGAATAEGVNRLLEIDPAAFITGPARRTVSRARQELTLAELRAEQFGYLLGQRTAAGVERAEQLPGDVAALPGRGAAALEDLTAAGRQRWELAGLLAEDVGFRAGQRTAASVSRAEALLGDMTAFPGRTGSRALETAGRARAAPREALAGFEFGRGAVGYADLPRFEAYPGQLQAEGRAFEFGLGAGERTAEVAEQTREVLGETRATIERTRETVASLPDLTLRVEPGLPRRPALPDAVIESRSREAPEPFGLDTTRTETDQDAEAPPDPRLTGTGGELVLRTEAETFVEPAREQAGQRPRRVETTAPLDAAGVVTEPAARTIVTQPGLETFGPVLLERGQTRLDLATEGLFEFRAETRLETETLVETEARPRAETRLDVEQRAEAEAETEAEFESESEFEFDRGADESRPWERDSPDFGGGRGGGETPFGAGWFSELVVAQALGPGPREAASQEQLAEAATGVGGLTGELPLEVELTGTEEEQAAIEGVREFYFAGGEDVAEDWDLL